MKKLVFIIALFFICSSADIEYVFYIPSQVSFNQYVGTLKFTDEDRNQTHVFKIVSGNTNTAFKIGAWSGAIYVNNPVYINSRTKKYFELVVEVIDSGSMDSTGKITQLSGQAIVKITTKK